jgi:hypothetical protein
MIEIYAPFAQKAVQKVGWRIEDCEVEIMPEPAATGRKRSNHVPGLTENMNFSTER